MVEINKNLIKKLFDKAVVSERKRMNYDLRTSSKDGGQRMLNALLPGTVVPIHRHPMSNENVILLCGKMVEVLFDDNGNEIERTHLDPFVGNFGCVVPAGVWHTVEVLEPSVIYEAKDGAYGSDGSEIFDSMKKLKEQIAYLIGMEHQSGSMDALTPFYVSRMLNVPLEEVEACMRELGL